MNSGRADGRCLACPDCKVLLQVSKLVSLHQGFQGSTGSPGSLSEKADLETAAPVLTEQWRQRWMGAKEDEQIEIGPMIGRGGYGKVFKGDSTQLILPAMSQAAIRALKERFSCSLLGALGHSHFSKCEIRAPRL